VHDKLWQVDQSAFAGIRLDPQQTLGSVGGFHRSPPAYSSLIRHHDLIPAAQRGHNLDLRRGGQNLQSFTFSGESEATAVSDKGRVPISVFGKRVAAS
jgi:hypothetical protein